MKNIYKSEMEMIQRFGLVNQFPEIEKGINKRRFTLKDLGVSHRWISYWQENGLMINDFEEGKMRRLNLIEYVWIKLIMRLREFKIPLSVIKKVKVGLFAKLPVEDMIKVESQQDLIRQFAKMQEVEIPDGFLKSKEFEDEVKKVTVNFFELIIFDIIILKNLFSLIITKEGDVIPYKERYRNDYFKHPKISQIMNSSYLSVSITDILVDFMLDNDTEMLCEEIAMITQSEKKVLDAVREGGLKSINVKIDKDNQIDLIEKTKDEKGIKRDTVLTKLIMKDGYQNINIVTQDGKVVSCKNTRKQKLK